MFEHCSVFKRVTSVDLFVCNFRAIFFIGMLSHLGFVIVVTVAGWRLEITPFRILILCC